MASLLIGVTLFAGAAGCASAGPFSPSQLAPVQLSQVQQICRSVLGIPEGVGLETDCVANLSASAVALSQARTMQAARRSCMGKGLAPGGPEFPQCELSTASEHAAAASDAADVRIYTGALEPTGKSYYAASSREIHKREQTACARLGYDPIDGGFAKCVASLDSALYASEHVMQ